MPRRDSRNRGRRVGGQLLDDDDEPVVGVEILVEQDDEEIGTDETDEEGRWLVEVPGAGTYTVTLDVESLADDVGLRDPERSTLDSIRVREGQTRPVLFQLGEARSTEVSRVDRLFSLAVDGVRLGLILALCSVGLSLIFGVTGLTNFAPRRAGHLRGAGHLLAQRVRRGSRPPVRGGGGARGRCRRGSSASSSSAVSSRPSDADAPETCP